MSEHYQFECDDIWVFFPKYKNYVKLGLLVLKIITAENNTLENHHLTVSSNSYTQRFITLYA